MERPALKGLLDDIGKKLVDVVVVYKVDRLTRSLTDFAKMVEASMPTASRLWRSRSSSTLRPRWAA